MPFERKQLRESVEVRDRERARERKHEITAAAQAEVPMRHLTKIESWDFFLSILQKKIKDLDGALAVEQETYWQDHSFNYEKMAEWKARQMQMAVQQDTLKQVIALPKQILEEGQKARFALRSIPDS